MLRERKLNLKVILRGLRRGFEKVRVILTLRVKNEVSMRSLGFVLHFTNGITDELLNIIILN